MKEYLRTQQNQGIIDSFPDMFANYQANLPASMHLVLRSACHASSARTCVQAELLPFPDLALASLYGHFVPAYFAPYFRTRNIFEARVFWFMAYRTRNIVFVAR